MKTGRPPKELLYRFTDRLVMNYDTGCWDWDRPSRNGYGVICDEQRIANLAHRIAFELFVGDLEDGKEIHHTCERRCCVNPNHLEQLNKQQHEQAHAKLRTHCKNNHEYVDGSFYYDRGARSCLICKRTRERISRAEFRKQFPPKPHAQASKTHCKRNHEFTPDNTYITKQGSRQCRECMRMHKAIWNAKHSLIKPSGPEVLNAQIEHSPNGLESQS